MSDYCLLASGGEGNIYLAVTPSVPDKALKAQHMSGAALPGDAEAHFISAVAEAYRTAPEGDKLAAFTGQDTDGRPLAIAMLALSVLAAYHMRVDAAGPAHAYYVRLADLLGCGMDGELPRGFSRETFEDLWIHASRWTLQRSGRHLASGIGHRFIGRPIGHVLLREVDIEKLPAFFEHAGYSPYGMVPSVRLERDLDHWLRTRNNLTPAGYEAYAGKRHNGVVAQVLRALEQWDGTVLDIRNTRVAGVEVCLEYAQRRPRLTLLARRPPGFPEKLSCGGRTFESYEEGWYHPLPLHPGDGTILLEGFPPAPASAQGRWILKRPGRAAIALVRSEASGFISDWALRPCDECAVLCHQSKVKIANDYLEEINDARVERLDLSSLLPEWHLFRGIVPTRRARVPRGLESLDVAEGIQIVASGGLRLGSGWRWFMEAPPQLRIASLQDRPEATIDGTPVLMDENGTLFASEHLSKPGTHIIEAGRVRRRLEIVEPQIAAGLQAVAQSTVSHRALDTFLPYGRWMLLGAVPGQVYKASRKAGQALAVSCPFEATWAIGYEWDSERVAAVCLVPYPPLPRLGRNMAATAMRSDVHSWAEIICGVALRHPRLGFAPDTATEADETARIWGLYVRAALQMRALRNISLAAGGVYP